MTDIEPMTELYSAYADGTIMQLGHTTGLVRATGAPFRSRAVHVSTVREGRLAGMRIFAKLPVMLAALARV